MIPRSEPFLLQIQRKSLFFTHKIQGREKKEAKGSNGLVHHYLLQKFVIFELAFAFSEILKFLCIFIKISSSQNDYKKM